MTPPAPPGSAPTDPLPEPAWVTAADPLAAPPCAGPPPCPAVPFPVAVARRRLGWRRRTARKRARLYAVAAAYRDGPCQDCGTAAEPMELAHLRPTPVTGRNRGKDRRIYDLFRHPEAYRRLCPRCHAASDPHRHV